MQRTIYIYKHTVNFLFSPPGGGAYLFQAHLREGLIETGGLFNLEATIAWVLHKELEYKVEKLKFEKLEVMQARIENQSELPVGE